MSTQQDSLQNRSYEPERIDVDARQLANLFVAEHEWISTSSKYFTAKEGEDSSHRGDSQPSIDEVIVSTENIPRTPRQT